MKIVVLRPAAEKVTLCKRRDMKTTLNAMTIIHAVVDDDNLIIMDIG
jgi:hypothetical protein